MTIDARFVILWIMISLKKGRGSSTFVKFELSSENYTQIYYIHQGNLVLNLAKIEKRWNFLRIFSKWVGYKIWNDQM